MNCSQLAPVKLGRTRWLGTRGRLHGDWQLPDYESAPAGTRASRLAAPPSGEVSHALGERPLEGCFVLGVGGGFRYYPLRSYRRLLAGRALPGAEGRGQTCPTSLATVGRGRPRRLWPEGRAEKR